MKITELLQKDTMVLNLEADSKDGVIDELVHVLDKAGNLSDPSAFKEAIHGREQESSTGIGEGIAIPHAKTEAVKTPAIAFGRSQEGTDYDSLDGQPAHLFFMIAASEGANQDHLQTLSRLSTLLMDETFRQDLLQASSEDEILTLVDEKEEEKLGAGEEEQQAQQSSSEERTTPQILAVTGCPTGIAHTFMAADALKEKAKEKGLSIKVETNGSDGIGNALTPEEIAAADGIIIASDTKVEMTRFDGRPVSINGVSDGMKRPEELIHQITSGQAPVYHAQGSAEEDSSSDSKGRTGFYKHLMNGVSNMLPFVVGGGVLMAVSFFFGINSAEEGHESYNAFAAALNSIGGDHAFQLMVAVLAGFIAMSIADRPGFAPGMIGGFMATTGGAGFLGGLIAGFLAGYTANLMKKALADLPKVLDGIKTILFYPVFNIFIIGLLMAFIINPPVSWLNTALQNLLDGMGTGNIVLLGLILGGMMAVDMGGPVNKAAFTFGIAMIDAGNFAPHAAIMAGGMVPPLGIALATSLFRGKFTKEERDAGVSSYFMGAFFITEGAIPFAAADPGRIIPAAAAGSAVAGALAMLFGAGLPAPHGGIFVFLTIQGANPLLYLAAILIGMMVTALLVGILKRPVK
ncbi:PTS fructose transporter subunit IIABC [Salibacterium qingdaonense]|uniref:PTS system D-fructose-specific IIA component (F1P-forming), Frc family /PTS system D-fructose-specific IIB component (F1P-forming), Frc family /PTS system D-fructose-specific IIC component (F1P-for... n=1 Tax=Salibacterium qingdaonense TaxID=266892 RepID=A0A1I4MY07_9BACI|nr:PTS fructose transporter subunit IIABC [Salibacterium qingdaonense]SFM08131.1 PTS system D-fructose-specific IIA component (F1P-forming), Frc family /PTS system D-fructose-specific IIB component (F1P-forming), Frc family /PTS system D-fructose-specific IIC component (F1P-forming), Frc family [Salibacterium qingdaonense]